jgi:hypothetical protein
MNEDLRMQITKLFGLYLEDDDKDAWVELKQLLKTHDLILGTTFGKLRPGQVRIYGDGSPTHFVQTIPRKGICENCNKPYVREPRDETPEFRHLQICCRACFLESCEKILASNRGWG